ncbi:MAG: DUF3784 domain-containing protein [Clostridia bacterium]|nr:DUF3784 domain-containing protein [Clostridia bacterium]MBO7403798.1 DUF3784 domain-containing protein [Clostridia bacterium]
MLLYSLIMFAAGAAILGVGIAVFRGRTDLIHDYHQEKVKAEDRLRYGRAMGTGILVLAAALLLSGILALCFPEGSMIPLITLFGGIVVSIVLLICAQKKYNGGIF